MTDSQYLVPMAFPFMSRRAFLGTAAGAMAGVWTGRPTRGVAGQKWRWPGPNDFRTGTIPLSCGKQLGDAELGACEARHTINYHHGFPTCRLEAGFLFDSLTRRPDTRIIALDRPGIGLSDPDPDFQFLNWPHYVESIADIWNLNRFSVIGISQGSPYALATARAMPARVTSVTLGSPLAPFEAVEGSPTSPMRLAYQAQKHPLAVALMCNRVTKPMRQNLRWLNLLVGSAAVVDRKLLAEPTTRDAIALAVVEAFRQGPTANVHSIAITARSWASWLKDVVQPVTVFHGCADNWASPAIGKFLVERLPNAIGHFWPGEGHFTGLFKHSDAVLASAVPPSAVDR